MTSRLQWLIWYMKQPVCKKWGSLPGHGADGRSSYFDIQGEGNIMLRLVQV